ncbi:MAG: carboxylesterase family protein [Chitinophagaceae bacterium]
MYMIAARKFLILTVTVTLFLAAYKTVPEFMDVVKTDAGQISGTRSSDGSIHIFKGIPFAAPPVGDLRWKAPQPVKTWSGIKKCEAFGASPMQGKPAPFSMWSKEFLIPDEPISEDCLYLNVWSGAKSSKDKLAVLVWIYGGGFQSGGSGVPIYDGEAMAKKGIVFVSINYRVGIFGFFAHPDLTKESNNHASGNYGLMDQVAALQWVKKNISAFGGDPNNVTIAGQSAGSMSVNCLAASPLTQGLFTKAIAESGASLVSSPLRAGITLLQAEEDGMKTAKAFNVSTVADLRKIPAEDLMKKSQGFRSPVIDGYVLPASISSIFAQNKENNISLLTGWNEDEGLLFGPIKNANDFHQQIGVQYGADSTLFFKYFPANDDAKAAVAQLKISRDMIFGVQNYTWANISSEKGRKTFVYRFTRKVPGTGEYAKYGAFHTGEVPYAYDNLKFVDRPWTQVDKDLATIMSSYWINFIKTGNPNGKDLPEWPAYTIEKRIMILGDQQSAKPIPDREALDFVYKKMSKE